MVLCVGALFRYYMALGKACGCSAALGDEEFGTQLLGQNHSHRANRLPTLLLMPIRDRFLTATTQHVNPVYHSQEELANARRGEKDAAERLKEAILRCTKAEESLAQARGERASFESALRDMERTRDAQAKELPDRASESHHAASQTSVAYRQYCDLEETLLRSQSDLEQARIDLASSKKKAADLEQQLEGSIAERNEAIQEARRNRELASARKEEIISVSKREQVSTTSTSDAKQTCTRGGTYPTAQQL